MEDVPTRLDEEEVELIFNRGSKVLRHFAGRLFNRYFSKAEITQNYTVKRGSQLNEMLDPVRIGYIKSHVIKRNGGFLGQHEWKNCLHMISSNACTRLRKKKEFLK
jgi:hypothetical protein